MSENYLRVRGEYPVILLSAPLIVELPPRARRIRVSVVLLPRGKGTTSACAENTEMAMAAMRRQGNYLRVRGEYSPKASSTWPQSELPPRARRIQVVENRNQHHIGTTSACAENTAGLPDGAETPGNYLRVRGEYLF